MPLIKPDLSQALEFAALEPNTYQARVSAVEYKTSKNGNPMIVPTFMLKVGDKEVKRQAYLVVNGEGAYGFGQLLRACGFTELADAYADKSIALADKPDFDTDDLVGHEINVVVDHTLYNGETRDQIKNYLRA